MNIKGAELEHTSSISKKDIDLLRLISSKKTPNLKAQSAMSDQLNYIESNAQYNQHNKYNGNSNAHNKNHVYINKTSKSNRPERSDL